MRHFWYFLAVFYMVVAVYNQVNHDFAQAAYDMTWVIFSYTMCTRLEK